MTKDIFCIKVRQLVIISLIMSDNVAPQHEQMRSWGIGCFWQPWNMTEVSSLHLHIVVRLQFCFQPLLHVWLRGYLFFSHWRSAVAQAASTSVTSTQCTTNSESNTMLWHVQLCYTTPTCKKKNNNKKTVFWRGYTSREWLSVKCLKPLDYRDDKLNVLFVHYCTWENLQQWMPAGVKGNLNQDVIHVILSKQRYPYFAEQIWQVFAQPVANVFWLFDSAEWAQGFWGLMTTMLKVFWGGHFAAFSGLCLQW